MESDHTNSMTTSRWVLYMKETWTTIGLTEKSTICLTYWEILVASMKHSVSSVRTCSTFSITWCLRIISCPSCLRKKSMMINQINLKAAKAATGRNRILEEKMLMKKSHQLQQTSHLKANRLRRWIGWLSSIPPRLAPSGRSVTHSAAVSQLDLTN